MFAKLFSSITESSLWSEPKEARLLFVTMLAKADQTGYVEASLPGLARVANLSLEETETALECLKAPDPYSKNPDNDGIRVLPVPGGFMLLNYEDYRARRNGEERRDYMRDYMRKYRKKTAGDCKQDVNNVNHSKPGLAQAETETETETETKEDKGGKPPGPPIPYSEILESFNAAFGSKCRWTSKRKTSIKARWRDPDWRESWKEAIELGGKSAFLTGENDRAWLMDFEFFLRPDTVTKILEGKYDNREAPAKKPFKQRMQTPEEMANWTGKG